MAQRKTENQDLHRTVRVTTKHGHDALILAESLPAYEERGWKLATSNKPVDAESQGASQPNPGQLEAHLDKPEKKSS